MFSKRITYNKGENSWVPFSLDFMKINYLILAIFAVQKKKKKKTSRVAIANTITAEHYDHQSQCPTKGNKNCYDIFSRQVP